eukprot:SAG31_NODE_1526_length_8004_cov_4.741176_3_plen_192_part_00
MDFDDAYCYSGDALSTCLNTVAILVRPPHFLWTACAAVLHGRVFIFLCLQFLVEFDNALYLFGLGERWRAKVESAGRVEMSDVELDRLGRSKWLHFVLVLLALTTGPILMSTFGEKEGAGHGSARYENRITVALPFCSFLVAGIVEATCWADQDVPTGATAMKAIALLVAKTIVGIVVIVTTVQMAFSQRF